MSSLNGDGRFKKAKGESFHQAGQKVWMVGMTVSVKKRKGKSFGIVVKDSFWPDMWVSVEVWNQDQFTTLCNKENGVKGKVQCPKRLQ